MSNNNTWPDPDTQLAGHGRQDTRGVYLLDPTTNKAYAASGGSGGAITNDGTFAKETGGNLAQLVTQLIELLTDTDNLTTIATNTSGLATDAHAANIVTNTATIATDMAELLTDTDNLANIPAKGAAATSASTPVNIASDQIVPANMSKWNGATPGVGNPVISEEQIRAYILNGQGFTAYINGNVTSGNAAAVSLYFSNPSKNILIYRVSAGAATAGSNCKLSKQTTDFALGAGSAVATNLNLGSSTTSIVTTITSSIATTSSGTIFDYTLLPSDIVTEILANNEVIYIPSGTTMAFAAFCDLVGTTGAGFVSISWLEI